MKLARLFFILFALPAISFGQGTLPQVDWVAQFGGPGSESLSEVAYGVGGDLIIVGQFQDSMDIDPGPGVDLRYAIGTIGTFLVSLDQYGALNWGHTFVADGWTTPTGLAVSPSGNIVFVATFRDTLDLDPGSATHLVFPAGAFAGDEMLVAQYDPAGNFMWGHSFGGASGDLVLDVAVDVDGSVFFVGRCGQDVDLDPGPGVVNGGGNGNLGMDFMASLDSLGNFVWANLWTTGSGKLLFTDLYCDEVGNLYAVGGFSSLFMNDTVDFDPGPGTAGYLSNGFDGFLVKYSTTGEFHWVRVFSSSADASSSSVSAWDPTELVVAGVFEGTTTFASPFNSVQLSSNGDGDCFVAKFDSSGQLKWARSAGGTGFDSGYQVVMDQSGGVVCVGPFVGQVDFDPSTGIAMLTAQGLSGGFLWSLDDQGDLLYAGLFDGPGVTLTRTLAINQNGALTLAGVFDLTSDLDPGSGQVIHTSAGSHDVFVCKLKAPLVHIVEATLPHFYVFPNPSASRFQVHFDEPPGAVTLSVYSVYGEVIFREKPASKRSYSIELNEPEGVYFLEITSARGRRVEKLLLR